MIPSMSYSLFVSSFKPALARKHRKIILIRKIIKFIARKYTLACQPALARKHRNSIMPCKDYGICRNKPTLSKSGLGQGFKFYASIN
jgi:hypothetical protein